MDIKEKTKDNINVRKDLKIICNRPELELDERRSNVMPKAVYTLGKDQKRRVCEWIRDLKFPDGYASNLARYVDMMELRMHGMKSHDCHVFMQKLISIAFSEMLSEHVWRALTEAYIVEEIGLFTSHYFEADVQSKRSMPRRMMSARAAMMDSRICVESSSYTDKENDFYGIIEEIIQLTYPLILNLHIMLFKYRWVDPIQGMKVHPSYHLVDVNFKKLYQKDDPFILAQQAVQVYFTEYPSLKGQSRLNGTSRRQLHENDEENEDEDEDSGGDDDTNDEEYKAT
ncbi:UNVERIFIED_CONTAM: hypothetical protein Sradi_2505900 [Sesamum radiatum]|uniref:DUF4216 domain-containing protein n=1 Tax=Sesamum radiatum TaxID=300843 RepID=A0AAW2SMG7_SESRA